MDFSLSQEQEMYREMFADFVAREVAPGAEEADRSEQLPARLLGRAARQGFMGALAPEESLGGAGLDTLSYTLLLETIGGACMSTALTLHVHNSLALRLILAAGQPSLVANLGSAMVAGERLGAFAMTEPLAGSDPLMMRTTARRERDRWILKGEKSWVTNGGLAGVYVVFAVTEPGAGTRSLSAFAVPAETPGLVVGGREKTLGVRATTITRLYLDDCLVPTDYLLGEVGDGYRLALESLTFGRIGAAAIAVGIGEQALRKAIRFSTERVQFGAPIAHKQAIQGYLADAATQVAAARGLVRQAAWQADQGKPIVQAAAMAKLFASRMAADVTDQAVQIHGGNGYIVDYGVERLYRDARALELIEGTSQIQQVIIASTLLANYQIKIKA
jgi:butyryl-CoA dehydrogenase